MVQRQAPSIRRLSRGGAATQIPRIVGKSLEHAPVNAAPAMSTAVTDDADVDAFRPNRVVAAAAAAAAATATVTSVAAPPTLSAAVVLVAAAAAAAASGAEKRRSRAAKYRSVKESPTITRCTTVERRYRA